MRKTIDQTMADLDALRRQPVTDATIDDLRNTLSHKSNFIVAKAAALAESLNLAGKLKEPLASAFKHLIAGGDKGCAATTAIAKALAAAEIEEEDVYLAGSTHVQMEASWGPPVDVAVELRSECLAALVRMNSRQMWDPLVRALADKHAAVRSTAARALGATGTDAAKYLLKYKILIGDAEASVMGDCFAAICLLTRSIEIVEPFLHDASETICEAAALALGESRLPMAFVALKRELPSATRDFRDAVLLAIAMTRQPGAVDCLIEVLTDSPLKGEPAMKALAMYRNDSAVRERVRTACENSQTLSKLFEEQFGKA